MSRLADLIAQLCPDGVEYRALGEMGSLFGGLSGKTKSDFTEVDGACPFVTYKEVYSLLEINQIPQGRVLVSSREKQLVLQRGDVLFTGSSENADEVGLTAVVTVGFSEPVYLNSFSICLRWYEHAFEPGYTKYVFASPSVRAQIRRCANGVTRFNLSKKRLEGVRVPVPPLEVQREIVRILDQFTTLEAELETELKAELEARRTQYEHYRNHLLSYDSLAARGPVEMVKLGELAHIATGGRNTSDAVENGTYPFYVRSQVPLSLNEYDFDESAVLTAGDGVGVGKVFHHVEGKYALHQRAYRIVPNLELLSSRYLYHVMVSQFGRYLESTVFHSSVTSVRKPMLERFPVAVPPMEEQDRVADVLDRFNALVNDITSGLPAEIAARRAQYEHYRDRLLSFPEKAVSRSNAS